MKGRRILTLTILLGLAFAGWAQDTGTAVVDSGIQKIITDRYEEVAAKENSEVDDEEYDDVYEVYGYSSAVPGTIGEPKPKILRAIPSSEWDSIKNNSDFGYAFDPDFWKQEKQVFVQSDPGLSIETILIFAGILAFPIFIFMLFRNKLTWLGGSGRRLDGHYSSSGTTEKPNWKKLAEEAEKGQDLRLALRYRYLFLLEFLDRLNYIRLAPEVANSTYIREMKQNLPENKAGLFEPFREIVRWYERVWYGHMSVHEDQYLRIKSSVEDLIKKAA